MNALVTGASRGIGAAVARAFAARGARLALHYHRNREAAERTLADLDGGPHALVAADLRDPEAAGPLFETARSELGHVDVLVNNAGIFEEHRVLEAEFGAWKTAWNRTLGTNLLSPAHLMFLAARHMKERGGGRIVNVTSRGAFRGEPNAPAYGASKAGLNSAGQSLARALGPHSVHVFAVAPGWVETAMARPSLQGEAGEAVRAETAIGRVATAAEIAAIVLFLATEAPESMTGCIVDANGASYLRT